VNPGLAAAKTDMNELSQWLDMLGAPLASIREKYARLRGHLESASSYGSLTGVVELSNREGLFYFKEDRLILIHIHSKPFLARLNGKTLLADLGSPAADLPSRAGKGFSQYVFPERGIAFSSDSAGQVAFVEVFQPMPLDLYLAQIYIDPGPFVR
jgi:hypothetical protein